MKCEVVVVIERLIFALATLPRAHYFLVVAHPNGRVAGARRTRFHELVDERLGQFYGLCSLDRPVAGKARRLRPMIAPAAVENGRVEPSSALQRADTRSRDSSSQFKSIGVS